MAHRKRIDWKGSRIDNTTTQRRCSSPATGIDGTALWDNRHTETARLLNQSQHKAMFAVDTPKRKTRDE